MAITSRRDCANGWRRRTIGIFGQAIVLTIGTLFPIMNPFSTAPLYISLTAGLSDDRRNRVAWTACIYALCILVIFLLLGSAIIDFFGISVAGIRVAGGVIISVIGFRMLFPAPPAGDLAQSPPTDANVAFTPLAMPSLAGPGSISVVLTAASRYKATTPTNIDLSTSGLLPEW
jgi:multiple antibiotic resistance protein